MTSAKNNSFRVSTRRSLELKVYIYILLLYLRNIGGAFLFIHLHLLNENTYLIKTRYSMLQNEQNVIKIKCIKKYRRKSTIISGVAEFM